VALRAAVDTNRLTDLFRGDSALADIFMSCDKICIPLIVLAEIEAGFLGGTQKHRNEALFQAFLAKATVHP
jgi:predicted nucleic acid-binding protein